MREWVSWGIRYDTTILMCVQKPTDANLIYRTEPITTRSPAVAEGPRDALSVEIW